MIIQECETFQDKLSYNYRIRSGMYVIEIDERQDFFQKCSTKKMNMDSL